jgi:ABC-type uncharacterized transport system permease subunit
MLSGISLLCFTASYGVALLLEASRLLFRAPVRFVIILLFAAAGLFAHTVYLGMRAQAQLPGGLPLSSWYEWCLLAAWVLAATYLGLMIRRPESALGIFVLPLVEALIGVAYLLKDAPAFERDEARHYWGMLHGVCWLLGMVAVMLGFVAGLMYLVQSYRLKHKLPPRQGFRLPSLEWLQTFSERSLVLSSLLLLAGIASGAVYNLVKQNSGIAWNDPVIVISGGLGAWLIVALLFNGLYRPARQGRKVAYLTVASFVMLLLLLGIVWSGSNHAQASDKAAAIEGAAR